MKQNELIQVHTQSPKQENFDALMASVSFELGYTLPDDITLVRYNEYLKLIELKHKAIKAQREKQLNGRTTT